MAVSQQTWWKIVVAEVDAPADELAAHLKRAFAACGFHSRGMHDDAESFLRSELLLLIPTRYEWRADIVAGQDGRASFWIRVGLAPGVGYYGALALVFATAIAAGALVTTYPELEAVLLSIMAGLLMLPIVQSIVLRLRGLYLERRLWRELAPLGAWRDSRIILRSLNQAYGEDRVIHGRDLSREAVERS